MIKLNIFSKPFKAILDKFQPSRHLAAQIEARNSKFETLTDKDENFFEKLLSKAHCITDTERLVGYNRDWMCSVEGHSKLVLLPTSTEELSAIMKYCYERNLAVCPQGGNTGLVGGSVPVYDEIVVSTKLMNNITSLDTNSNILSCQSGCILQSLDEYLSKTANLMMPLDLGAKGSCQIGGNVSTNAGGLRLLRYGSLRNTVLGIEAVLPNGEIFNSMKTSLRKDNTGLDLKQMFIGAEGILGIVSQVSILCPVKPNATNLIMIACKHDTFSNVIEVFKMAKKELNEILSAFEFMDRESMKAVCKNLALENPFNSTAIDKNCEFYCLAETHGSCHEHDVDKIERFYARLSKENLCQDAVIAENSTQFNQIWALRERLAEALIKDGFNYKYDVSLPIDRMYNLVLELRKRLYQSETESFKRCIGYGHMGDGNLHINVTSATYDEKLFNLLEPWVFQWTKDNFGSISAEHGLGLKKREYIYYSKPKEVVNIMKKFKQIFDPKGICNPYKTLPQF